MSRNENYLGLALPGVGAVLIIMASQGVFYFIILFTVESTAGNRARRLMGRLCRCGAQQGSVSPNDPQPRPSQVERFTRRRADALRSLLCFFDHCTPG